MASFVALFDETLTRGGATVPTAAALEGKTVGIYFSAHWCPPCRRFTPELAKVYTELTVAGRPFEVVFVSSDRDEASFAAYCATMPWLALPFADRERKAALSSRFKVKGVPTLVLLNAAGEVISADGRAAVGSSGAAGFPWTPQSIGEALGAEPLVDASGKSVPVPSGRYVALYFSASWCPPCRGFTPKLAAAYKALNAAAGKQALEVIFVSADRDEASCKAYHKGKQPWLAVPYAAEARRAALNTAAGVRGIPALLLCERDVAVPGGLRVINVNARDAVEAGRPFPAGWLPPAPWVRTMRALCCAG